jgi:hypothetical protein
MRGEPSRISLRSCGLHLLVSVLLRANYSYFNRGTVSLEIPDEKAEAGKARDSDECSGQRIRHSGSRAACKEDGRSLANWLERLIETEAARHDGKK